MPDAGWQELERAWRAATSDQDLLQRAIAARRRVGVPAPYDMLQARRRPARTFSSRLRFDVWVETPDGEIDLVGQTGGAGAGGADGSVAIPAHKTWSISPATSSDMDQVARELHRGEVPGFSLSSARLNQEALEPLRDVPDLERLAFLQCSGLTPASLTSLRGVPHLADLSLVFCGAGDEASLEVVGSLTSLVELNLAGAPADDHGVAHLVQLHELAALNLSSASLTDAGLESLGSLRQLRDLRIQAAYVSERGLRALSAAPRLQVLHLGASGLEGQALSALATWEELRELGLEGCRDLRGEDWSHLRAASGLRSLSLEQAPFLDDEAFQHVVSLPELEDLVVSGAPIGAASLRALRGRSLHSLVLSDCPQLGAGAVEAFGELRSLRSLSLDDCPLTWEDVEHLRAALPDCQVEWTEPV